LVPHQSGSILNLKAPTPHRRGFYFAISHAKKGSFFKSFFCRSKLILKISITLSITKNPLPKVGNIIPNKNVHNRSS
jgi:hypothetical protein